MKSCLNRRNFFALLMSIAVLGLVLRNAANSADGSEVTVTGDVWTGPFLILDDMDSYYGVAGHEIYETWKDYRVNSTGSQVHLWKGVVDPEFVRDGNSMRFHYKNTIKIGKYVGSKAEADTTDLQFGPDWTAGGVKSLSLWFYGDSGNLNEGQNPADDQMYVALETGAGSWVVSEYPDMNDIKEASWHEWNIDLQDFNDGGITLSNVTKMYIGFGGYYETGQSKRGAGWPSGVGDTVYFDDIRLYPPAPSNTTPAACIVGGDRTIEVGSGCEAKVVLDGSCSSDADSTPGTNDDIVYFDWYKVDPCDPDFEDFLGSGEIIECNLPLGEHDIVLEVIDKVGAFDTNEVTITVEDTTPPEFDLGVTPDVLWPPNHKMVLIRPAWTVSDNCDESPEVTLVSVTIDGDNGQTNDDIQIGDDGIWLRAERGGKGISRVYTITYQAVDDSGNVTVDSATVTVPHNRRRSK